jgi:endonuclease III
MLNSISITATRWIADCLFLAAEARDELVRQITPDLFAKDRSPKDYAKCHYLNCSGTAVRSTSLETNPDLFGTASLGNWFGGRVPGNLEELLSLPVDIKLVSVLLGNVFGNRIRVDTHVMRLSHRIGLRDKKDTEDVEMIYARWCRRLCARAIGSSITAGAFT